MAPVIVVIVLFCLEHVVQINYGGGGACACPYLFFVYCLTLLCNDH